MYNEDAARGRRCLSRPTGYPQSHCCLLRAPHVRALDACVCALDACVCAMVSVHMPVCLCLLQGPAHSAGTGYGTRPAGVVPVPEHATKPRLEGSGGSRSLRTAQESTESKATFDHCTGPAFACAVVAYGSATPPLLANPSPPLSSFSSRTPQRADTHVLMRCAFVRPRVIVAQRMHITSGVMRFCCL